MKSNKDHINSLPEDVIQHPRPTRSLHSYVLPAILVILGLAGLCTWAPTSLTTPFAGLYSPLEKLELASHCAHVAPITAKEFLDRQIALSNVLIQEGASAYIAEPGANTLFYANFSMTDWRLSERPLLLIITPATHADLSPHITILAPKFETTRARLLNLPHPVRYLHWDESENPYRIASTILDENAKLIFVDSAIRKFISDGFERAAPHSLIMSAPKSITQLRERKSPAELDILKCAHEVTLLAMRQVHAKMYIGMHESTARTMMASAFQAAGLSDGGCLTLFGENAALPHGSGTDRALLPSDFALFDCTATLHGYHSDITRTVALQGSKISDEHKRIWHHVRIAQALAFQAAYGGAVARTVDEAARSYLSSNGYGAYFTHRLGHGIGLEGHESPYLNGGSEDIIQPGHTFSNEPGVYINGKLGVRLEDCFYLRDDGQPVYLTQGVGGVSSAPLSM